MKKLKIMAAYSHMVACIEPENLTWGQGRALITNTGQFDII